MINERWQIIAKLLWRQRLVITTLHFAMLALGMMLRPAVWLVEHFNLKMPKPATVRRPKA